MVDKNEKFRQAVIGLCSRQIDELAGIARDLDITCGREPLVVAFREFLDLAAVMGVNAGVSSGEFGALALDSFANAFAAEFIFERGTC